MRVALLALVLLLGTLVPQSAQAHGGHAHEAAPPVAAPSSPSSAPAEESREALSAPCAPGGGTGHVCGCGNLSLCDGRTQAPVAVASGAVRETGAVSQRIAAPPAAPPSPRPPFPAASPRAPPLSS